MAKHRYAVLLFVFCAFNLTAQNLPDGILYTTVEIPEIRITIDQDSLDQLYLPENWYENHEYPVEFIFQSSQLSDTLQNVGIRFRGNTSREKIKKSFKISFNTFEPGRKFQNVEKLNINAEVNDPSMVRSFNGWELYHYMGVPAPRSNHVKLFINGDYYGLYQNAEHIDDEFVESWYGTPTGNLYKCRYPADLDFISTNPDDYKQAPWGERTYELKTNEELDDYADIAEFITELNQMSDSEFDCKFYEYFDVNSYIKLAVADILLGNWDGYIYNQNNYYLYHNPLTDQFQFIPYDIDNTWGIDWLDRDWSDRNIYTWSQTFADRPLFNRIMDSEKYRDMFTWYMEDLLSNYYGSETHLEAINQVHDQITPDAIADTYRPLDFSFSVNDFLLAIDEAAGGHVDFGVGEFIEIRKSSAQNQLESVNIPPIITHVREDFENVPESFTVSIEVDGPPTQLANLTYTVSGDEFSLEQSGNSEVYEFIIPIEDWPTELSYNVALQGEAGLMRMAYCESRTLGLGDEAPLVINEVMTSNDATIQDSFGEYDDWIEIYHSGSSLVNTTGYYLTDNSSSPTKWALPGITLEPGEHELFWADKTIIQGNRHTNFRLNNTGEKLFLFKKLFNGIRLVDYVDVPSLPADYSWGRSSDGADDWILFEATTPNAPNGEPLSANNRIASNRLEIYPNPSASIFNFSEPISYQVFDLQGKLVEEGDGESIAVYGWPTGVYILRVDELSYRLVVLSD